MSRYLRRLEEAARAATVHLVDGGSVPLPEARLWAPEPRGPKRLDHPVPILTIKLGTAFGWALRWDRDHLASGVEDLSLVEGDFPGPRVHRFREWLREMLEVTGAVLVAYERPHVRSEPLLLNLEGVLLGEVERRVDYVAPTAKDMQRYQRRTATHANPLVSTSRRWGKEVQQLAEADALDLLAWVLDVVGEPGA